MSFPLLDYHFDMIQRTLSLGRSSLETFLICRRRFRLRIVDRLPWPATPLDGDTETAVANGRAFHQQLERHFLQLRTDSAPADPALRQWWQAFQHSRLPLPDDARLLPELSLSVPLGSHHLVGRFDLLAISVSPDDGRYRAHIFDWKTSRPRAEATLRSDWQTRLYLALLAEGSQALFDDDGATGIAPDDISITYWYVREPDTPRTLHYSSAWHADNWAELAGLLAQIDGELADESSAAWPLTDQLSHCRDCAYQVYCGRQAAGTAVVATDPDDLIDAAGDPDDVEPDVVPQ